MDSESRPNNRGRRERGINPKQGIIIGVATVAGLGVLGKILSILSREKPNELKDKEIETLEAVLNGDPAQSIPLQAQVQRTKLANLEDDEPDHVVESRHKNAKRANKFVDSFSEEIQEEDIPEEGELYVSQDPVGSQPKSKRSPGQGGVHIKGLSQSNAEGGGKHQAEKSIAVANSSSNELSKESTSTSDDLERSPSLTQKKSRRTSSADSKHGRKNQGDGSGGKDVDPLQRRKLKSLPEGGTGEDQAEAFVDAAGRWECVNGYKVLRATSSKIPNFSEAMHKWDEDTSLNSSKSDLVRELERERAENEVAQSMWDGKVVTRNRDTEDSEAYLRIKSSVVSSISDAEETPDGVRVREVVKRSTLLPIPAGGETEVHSSVYNVEQTDQGLKVEEVVTRTKLLPIAGDFAFSDRQLLRKRKKSTYDSIVRMLPLLLRVVALLLTLLGVLIVLMSRKRISLPHLGFFY